MDKTKMAVDVFSRRAVEYQSKFMDFDLYNDTFDLFCDSVTKPKASILELGCGPGNITYYLQNKRPDLKILATDLSPAMLELARQNNPKANTKLMDCRDISKLDEKYDGIMAGFCLPYLTKEEAVNLIKDASLILHSEGVLYLSTMEDDYNNSALQTSSSGDQLYIHYHQADYLTQALIDNGFNIINLQRKDFSKDGATATDLITIARKN